MAFSTTSVPRRAPMIWLAALKLLEIPPPFEFWINTTKISSTQVMMIRMVNNVCIMVSYYLVFNFSIRDAK